jgi:hypothetical protein
MKTKVVFVRALLRSRSTAHLIQKNNCHLFHLYEVLQQLQHGAHVVHLLCSGGDLYGTGHIGGPGAALVWPVPYRSPPEQSALLQLLQDLIQII